MNFSDRNDAAAPLWSNGIERPFLDHGLRAFTALIGTVFGLRPFIWAKSTYSDRDQQSDSYKTDKKEDGPDKRTTRPQKARCARR
jgi:hypothetical protein